MKNTLIFIFLLLFKSIVAQEKITTTDDEYNYLTQGYAEQLQKGLDMKSGYELKKIDQ